MLALENNLFCSVETKQGLEGSFSDKQNKYYRHLLAPHCFIFHIFKNDCNCSDESVKK